MVFDPITALNIAGNVVQFVDFGTKLFSKSKELYKSADGVLADHAEYAAIASRLAELSKGLSNSTSSSSSNEKPSPVEDALEEVTSECTELANDFADAFSELRVNGNHRKWKSFRQAFKSMWKKKGLEE